MTSRLVLATHNLGKVREVAQVFAALGGLEFLELVGAGQLGVAAPVEDGLTFAKNALIKAEAAGLATGLPVLAEDSGLCVAALGGAPGVFSARWAGRHGNDQANLELLLDQLADVPDRQRAAWYEAAAVLLLPSGERFEASGRMPGHLARVPAGSGGFGYDPIFVPEGMAVTAAQLGAEQKNAISHRGQALRALAPALAQLRVS